VTAPFRCSSASLFRDEQLVGTASTVRAFLLVECPGPWGADAVRENRLPAPVRAMLSRCARQHRVRPLLIRRHGRRQGPGLRAFTAYVDRHGSRLETTHLDRPEDLLDLDLTGLATGGSAGLPPTDEPMFLVCTHGKHDVCCAERGRPVALALSKRFAEHTWEVSHIGGDRFAGNVLVLPDGLYYGRVSARAAVRLADLHLAGELDLEHLRGRSSLPFAVQAAEISLRRELGITGKDALSLRESVHQDRRTRAVFTAKRLAWQVTMEATELSPQRLTCQASRDNPAPTFRLVSIEPIG